MCLFEGQLLCGPDEH